MLLDSLMSLGILYQMIGPMWRRLFCAILVLRDWICGLLTFRVLCKCISVFVMNISIRGVGREPLLYEYIYLASLSSSKSSNFKTFSSLKRFSMIIVFCPSYYPNSFLLHDDYFILKGFIRGSPQGNAIVHIWVN